jgi:hypothetical protein
MNSWHFRTSFGDTVLNRSMALKESQHVATVDRLNEELESLRRQHDDLATTSRDQVHRTNFIRICYHPDPDYLGCQYFLPVTIDVS